MVTFDGFVQRQEKGNTFDGTAILGRYRSPDLSFGDTGIRKQCTELFLTINQSQLLMQTLFLRYDNEAVRHARPAAYSLDHSTMVRNMVLLHIVLHSAATQFVYGGPSQPLVRQPVEGSGFTVALKIDDGGEHHHIH